MTELPTEEGLGGTAVGSVRPLGGVRVCMLRAQDYATDGRARKQAAAFVEAGSKVTMIGVGNTVPRDLVDAGYEVHILPHRRPSVLPRLGHEDVWWPVRVSVNLTWTRMANWLLRRRYSRLLFPQDDALLLAAIDSAPDVVHAYNIHTLSAAVRVKQATGARVVYDSRDLYTDIGYVPKTKRRKLARAEAELLRSVDETLVVCEPRADVLETRYGIRRPVVIYNGPAEVMPSASPVHAPVRLLFQGSFHADRNLEALVEAMVELKGFAVLSLQGFSGVEQELRDQVTRLDLDEHVLFVPPAPPLGVVRSASEHDVGIICHKGETLNHQSTVPNKLMDYLGAGLAVAASDLPGHRSVLEGTGAGVFIDPSSADTIADGLQRLVSNSGSITEMKRAALETAWRYEWPVQAKKMIQVYESVLSDSGPPLRS